MIHYERLMIHYERLMSHYERLMSRYEHLKSGQEGFPRQKKSAEGRRDAEAWKRLNFQKKKVRKNIKSGLYQPKIAQLEAISSAIDVGASPAPFSLESGFAWGPWAQGLPNWFWALVLALALTSWKSNSIRNESNRK